MSAFCTFLAFGSKHGIMAEQRYMCGDMISREHQVSFFARVGKLKTQGDFIKVAPCKFSLANFWEDR